MADICSRSPVIPHGNEDSTLLRMLQEACSCSCRKQQVELLSGCFSYLTTCDSSKIEEMLLLKGFPKLLDSAVGLAIVSSFEDREHYSYTKEDFLWYPEITYYVLSINDRIVSHVLAQSQNSPDTSAAYKNSSSIEASGGGKEDKLENTSTKHDITFLLPKTVLLIYAHMNRPVWSSKDLETLSLQVLDKFMALFLCETPNELLSRPLDFDSKSAGNYENHTPTLFQACLSHCYKPLSKIMWFKNPFLCHSFHCILLQMKLPNLSDHIELIMSVALNFFEDYQTVNKLRGISCLHHLIKNTSSEEMRWLNRAEVIYEKLKNQMYSKESMVIEQLHHCLFDILTVLESPPDIERHQFILDALIRDTEGENLLVLRRVYIDSLTFLVFQIGIYSVQHLKSLVTIVGNYLEVDDGFDMSARPGALKLLAAIIKVAWPRIQPYAGSILKLCLSFIADINCAKSEEYSDMQADLTDQTIQCLMTLSAICPEIVPCLQAGLKSGMGVTENDSHLFNVLKKQLAKIESPEIVIA